MSRGDQLHRQWTILRLVSSGRRSRRELAERLDVSLKTISRDIEALSLFPISEARDGIDVFYELVRGARPPAVDFDEEEVAALLLGEPTVLAALDGTPYREHVAAALAKLRLLQRGGGDPRRPLPEVLRASFDAPRAPEAHREALLAAARERRRVWIRYHTAERGRSSERVVEPLALHHHPHGLHLIARCLRADALLYFSVARIEALRVLDETFTPELLDLDAFLATTFDGRRGLPVLDVCLRVREPTASWARERAYHPSQALRELDDGVEIRFRAGAPAAIVARVLSLGPDCEVVAPASLRRAVAAQVRALAERYADEDEGADEGADAARAAREENSTAPTNPGPDLSAGGDTSTSRPTAAAPRERVAESENRDDD
ncbi:MAG: WYL domain-containing protein [Nannocystaceae bacterium]